ncbi:phospholipase D family protein [Otariodibacter oris]|uniref:Phospholipase D-like protein n=1 Tax=Otariodibacter oris TaxID=1032623 RepID=A0A420XEN4_9PAST|nr:phospholipase D family protein [Otariodibacter oris]QGM81405.1 hypothetical protein A6A10_08315 [Otariodibacter oris]RKR70780.1 phospholipase D-like protein [Otariodibacter oris]
MKFITKQSTLTAKFNSLVNKYKNISFATAWASSNHPAFETLLMNKTKIQSSTVGIHFYQTDPQVLIKFKSNKQVKISLQASGVFHPKVYLFWNDENDWAVLSGSANFTHGAFHGKNTENMMFINSEDVEDNKLFNEVSNFLDQCFKSAKEISKEYIKRYEELYSVKRKSINKLTDFQSKSILKNPVLDNEILTCSWAEYFQEVKKDPYHNFKSRLKMLELFQYLFKSHETFSMINEDNRKFICGLKCSDERAPWFGNLQARGTFSNRVNTNNKKLSSLIDGIPLEGNINKELFMHYAHNIDHLCKGERETSVVTRIISMKRPDLFISFNGANKGILKDFGISSNSFYAERYWDELLSIIYETPWFNRPEPKDPEEKLAWKYRVALLDCIYYKPQ